MVNIRSRLTLHRVFCSADQIMICVLRPQQAVLSTKTTKTITTKDIADLDMRKTNVNTFTLEIASKQSIATGSITITETPTTNMTLGMTSHETTTSGL